MRGAYYLKQPASGIHGRAELVITRATEKAYLVDRRP